MTEKNPEQTRARILQAAYEEIYQHGFHATSVDDILAKTGVTKGALYHHFQNKKELGYAVVDEVIRVGLLEMWLKPLRDSRDPILGLQQVLTETFANLDENHVKCGCPLNNLAQEMSNLDEGFRIRIGAVYREWRNGIKAELQRGQEKGFVREDVDADGVATILIALFEGLAGMMKTEGSRAPVIAAAPAIASFLESLRPGTVREST